MPHDLGFNDVFLESEVLRILQVDLDQLAHFPEFTNKLRDIAKFFSGDSETIHRIRAMLNAADYSKDKNISFLDFVWHRTQVEEHETNQLNKVEEQSNNTEENDG